MDNTLRARISELLGANGWTPIDCTAIARKTFATAVGPKEAHIYLADFGPDNATVMLQGDYQSEGRNALGGCCVLIPRDAEGDKLADLVGQFARSCDAQVADTYAARLLRPVASDASSS